MFSDQPAGTLQVHCDQPITRLELIVGESRYSAKTALPVLEVCVEKTPATLTTSIRLSN